MTVTGLSRHAVCEALETLAAWQLVEPVYGHWRLVAGASLELLAERFGCCLEQVCAQVGRHRLERAAYRRVLRIVDRQPTSTVAGAGRDEWYLWPPEPPPDDLPETLLDLLYRELSAFPIPVPVGA